MDGMCSLVDDWCNQEDDEEGTYWKRFLNAGFFCIAIFPVEITDPGARRTADELLREGKLRDRTNGVWTFVRWTRSKLHSREFRRLNEMYADFCQNREDSLLRFVEDGVAERDLAISVIPARFHRVARRSGNQL